ncbi:MAG: zinc finger MYND domain-containing protein [Sphingobacteriaceae bacterium]|nr:MAG: zinc finger MYND domain-containing protein [Sphingobacteriaceae bacterium]
MHAIKEIRRAESNYVLFVCGNNLGFSNLYSDDQVIQSIKQSGIDLSKASYTHQEMVESIQIINRCCGCDQSTVNGSIACPSCSRSICQSCVIGNTCPSCNHEIERKIQTKRCSGIVFVDSQGSNRYCERVNITKKCGFCKDVFYCSDTCKSTHWAVHRAQCRTMS